VNARLAVAHDCYPVQNLLPLAEGISSGWSTVDAPARQHSTTSMACPPTANGGASISSLGQAVKSSQSSHALGGAT
jgi:hypothetical protein